MGARRTSIDQDRFGSVDQSNELLVVGGTDDERDVPGEVAARDDVVRHVLVMRLDRGLSLQKHELVFVVFALIQLEGLAIVRRSTGVASLRQKCTQSVERPGKAWKLMTTSTDMIPFASDTRRQERA